MSDSTNQNMFWHWIPFHFLWLFSWHSSAMRCQLTKTGVWIGAGFWACTTVVITGCSYLRLSAPVANNHRWVYINVWISSLPSCWVNKPVPLPFPFTGGQKALLFELHFSSDIGELMATDEAGCSPLAQHTGLVFILWEESRWLCNQSFTRLKWDHPWKRHFTISA